jgi:hypothetical protein
MAKTAPAPHKMWVTNSCPSGKRAYVDRAAGKAAARLLAKRGFGNMRPYTCPKCSSVHIGHQRW